MIVHWQAYEWITAVLLVDVFAGVHRPIAGLSKQLAENPLVVGVALYFGATLLSEDIDQYFVFSLFFVFFFFFLTCRLEAA